MKPDWYTKAVLTVIALSLVWMCSNGFTPSASAQAQGQADRTRPTPVVLVDEHGLPLTTPQGLRVSIGDQSVPVVIGNQTLPVVLTAVQRQGAWEAIQVDVVKPPSTLLPTP
jgi:hypothetical protein